VGEIDDDGILGMANIPAEPPSLLVVDARLEDTRKVGARKLPALPEIISVLRDCRVTARAADVLLRDLQAAPEGPQFVHPLDLEHNHSVGLADCDHSLLSLTF
jgi:hypothetical protein